MSEPLETIAENKTTTPGQQPPAPAPGITKTVQRTYAAPRSGPRRQMPSPDEEDDVEGFFQRYRIALIVGAVVLAGAAWAVFRPSSGPSPAPRKAPEPQMVKLVIPPPPPPPPPKVQPPPPQDVKRPEQAPTEKPVEKPAEAPKPAEKPPEGLTTTMKGGPGTSGLALGRGGNGMLGGTGTGPGGGKAGSLNAWYAGQVKLKIMEALRQHPKTRKSAIKDAQFTVALNGQGHVTKATILASTGDTALDAAIQNEILTGLTLAEPPPGGKPMTVTLRINAQRPK